MTALAGLLEKTSNSSTYLLAVNGCNLIVLVTLALGRMLVRAHGTDGECPIVSEVWCRARNSLGTVASLTSLTCICLASFDRWLTTSHSVRRRQWSSHRLAILAVCLSIFLWFILTGIPSILLAGLVQYGNLMVCSYLTQSFANYNNMFFIPVVYCVYGLVRRRSRLLKMNIANKEPITPKTISILIPIVKSLSEILSN